MKPLFFLLIACLLSVTSAFAQTETPGVPFGYGTPVSGTLNNSTPDAVYQFTGLRGDVIAIDLTVTSGDLDPMVTLTDSQGDVIALSDDAAVEGRGSRDLHLESLHIPRSDQYSLVVARFGYGLGITSGGYTLAVDRIGVSSASGSALRYGDSVYNTITDSTPQVYYSFRAARGDVISVRMQRASGDLDPALMIVNSQSQIIANNDDSPGTLDAAINGFIVRDDGVYVIIASRFGEAAGRSKGSFVLTLNSAAQSGLGRTVEFALPILPGVAVQGEITDDADAEFYAFDGKRDDIVTIRMNRASGDLDAFLSLLDGSQREIITDDDSGGGQNSLINRYVLPADGRYTIVATRYERDSGDTQGQFQLLLDVSGSTRGDGAPNSTAQGVPRIDYNSTVSGSITSDATQVFYAFVGQEGDQVTVTMSRIDGNLNSRVAILNAARSPLISDDDSGGNQNARIDSFTLPTTGVYYIVATRYSGSQGDPNTTGSYSLTLIKRAR